MYTVSCITYLLISKSHICDGIVTSSIFYTNVCQIYHNLTMYMIVVKSKEKTIDMVVTILKVLQKRIKHSSAAESLSQKEQDSRNL